MTIIQDDEMSEFGLTYKPNLKKILSNQKAVYCFENQGSGFRLLRILDGKRTHDFIFQPENELIFENSESQSCILKFENSESLEKFVSDVANTNTVYFNYKRNFCEKDNQYSPEGEKETVESVTKFVRENYFLNNAKTV